MISKRKNPLDIRNSQAILFCLPVLPTDSRQKQNPITKSVPMIPTVTQTLTPNRQYPPTQSYPSQSSNADLVDTAAAIEAEVAAEHKKQLDEQIRSTLDEVINGAFAEDLLTAQESLKKLKQLLQQNLKSLDAHALFLLNALTDKADEFPNILDLLAPYLSNNILSMSIFPVLTLYSKLFTAIESRDPETAKELAKQLDKWIKPEKYHPD